MSTQTTLECGCEVECDNPCEECCEHGDICTDDRICLDCGKDMTEHLYAQAEDAWDAARGH